MEPGRHWSLLADSSEETSVATADFNILKKCFVLNKTFFFFFTNAGGCSLNFICKCDLFRTNDDCW